MPSVKESVRDYPGVIAFDQNRLLRGNRFDAWFAKVPVQIAIDRRVKHREFRLYCVIAAHAFSGNVARVGQRRLATLLRISQTNVSRSINALIETGWLSRTPSPNGKRTEYILTSPAVFKPDSKPAPVCTQCQQFKRNLPITSICRECVKLANDRKRMAHALQTLGDNATDQEVAAFCEIDKITPRWRKIRRDIMGVDKDVS
jgi:DNA-binding MarR family transcriptional regulator